MTQQAGREVVNSIESFVGGCGCSGLVPVVTLVSFQDNIFFQEIRVDSTLLPKYRSYGTVSQWNQLSDCRTQRRGV